MAKRNLQEFQSKMKVWYDRKTRSRCFEPGDRVLVLFPVVGNPLQAKFKPLQNSLYPPHRKNLLDF